MEKQAVELGLDKGSGSSLVDQYIEICPDELPMMGMFDLNEKGSVSVKPGNAAGIFCNKTEQKTN